MIDWDSIDRDDIIALALIAGRHHIGIDAMLRSLDSLSSLERSLVEDIITANSDCTSVQADALTK